MSNVLNGEFVWYQRTAGIVMAIMVKPVKSVRRPSTSPSVVHVANTKVELLPANSHKRCVYRVPTTITMHRDYWEAGPVYAILAASDCATFQGSQLNFRDIMNAGRSQKVFVYVLPTAQVSSADMWQGYVRLGYQNWIAIPCPHPEAVYNRIPTRYLERRSNSVQAKEKLKTLRIPMFNPDYFNKADIYDALRDAGHSAYLPSTYNSLSESNLRTMLREHEAIYLKPAGGSVGHGMIRIEKEDARRWTISVLKNGLHSTLNANTLDSVWKIVQNQRVPGQYVLQEAVSLVEWAGRPCDFRVLLQKTNRDWRVVGKGVRVSGPNAITTHVPNGGKIANAADVLEANFVDRAKEVEHALEAMVTACAQAIDTRYNGQFGEMSMDIGIDSNGDPWFFEANAKPMKFDEKDIRRDSIQGVLSYLHELKHGQSTT